jgi:hypothetical protein
VNLGDGTPVAIDTATARTIALGAAPRLLGRAANIKSTDLVDRDQWTVGEEYEFDRPLYHFAFDDSRSTEVYVSSTSGSVVLWTTGAERFWNWLGAIPHWLYFTRLRSNGPLWSRIVIWTSITGAFLAVLGLCLGIAQFRRGSGLSPYRGWTWWHHLSGLVFGAFALTWVISGTISMNPWGFLEGRGGNERIRLAGDPLPWSVYRDSLKSIVAADRQFAGMVTLTSAPQAGNLYWLARWPDGRVLRLNASGRPAPINSGDLDRLAELLADGRKIESREALNGDDTYFYSGANADGPRPPVYRVILADDDHTRYYLDRRTGALLGRVDPDRRGYRWLFDGMHRLDFFAWLRMRPLWDAVMLLLLIGGLALTGTGFILALTRIKRDVTTSIRAIMAGLRRFIPPVGERSR